MFIIYVNGLAVRLPDSQTTFNPRYAFSYHGSFTVGLKVENSEMLLLPIDQEGNIAVSPGERYIVVTLVEWKKSGSASAKAGETDDAGSANANEKPLKKGSQRREEFDDNESQYLVNSIPLRNPEQTEKISNDSGNRTVPSPSPRSSMKNERVNLSNPPKNAPTPNRPPQPSDELRPVIQKTAKDNAANESSYPVTSSSNLTRPPRGKEPDDTEDTVSAKKKFKKGVNANRLYAEEEIRSNDNTSADRSRDQECSQSSGKQDESLADFFQKIISPKSMPKRHREYDSDEPPTANHAPSRRHPLDNSSSEDDD